MENEQWVRLFLISAVTYVALQLWSEMSGVIHRVCVWTETHKNTDIMGTNSWMVMRETSENELFGNQFPHFNLVFSCWSNSEWGKVSSIFTHFLHMTHWFHPTASVQTWTKRMATRRHYEFQMDTNTYNFIGFFLINKLISLIKKELQQKHKRELAVVAGGWRLGGSES